MPSSIMHSFVPSLPCGLQFIQQQLSDEEKALAAAQGELLTFKVTYNLDSLSQEVAALQNQIRQLQLERAKLVVERERIAAVAAKYRERPQS